MTGTLGIGGNLNKWTDDELKEAAQWVHLYKKIRHVVQMGTLYRLMNESDDGIYALQYVYGNESVAFVFAHGVRFGKRSFRLRLRGLDASSQYRVEVNDGEAKSFSGSGLHNVGVEISVMADYDCAIVRVGQN